MDHFDGSVLMDAELCCDVTHRGLGDEQMLNGLGFVTKVGYHPFDRLRGDREALGSEHCLECPEDSRFQLLIRLRDGGQGLIGDDFRQHFEIIGIVAQ